MGITVLDFFSQPSDSNGNAGFLFDFPAAGLRQGFAYLPFPPGNSHSPPKSPSGFLWAIRIFPFFQMTPAAI